MSAPRVRFGLPMSLLSLASLAWLAAACGRVPSTSAVDAASKHPHPTLTVRSPATIRVAAASSLRDVLETAAEVYSHSESEGAGMKFSFDASSTLARQIQEGAPFDVFLSADEGTMDRVADRIVPGTRRVFLSNRLALAGRAGWAPAPVTPGQLATDPALAGARLALPGAAVPAGRYWREWMTTHGVLAAIEPRCVVSDSVRAALALVEAGSVDAAFVYATDIASTSGRVTLLSELPATEGPAIAYVAAQLRDGDRDAASEADTFVRWLGGDDFRRLALAAGFSAPP